MDDTPWMEWRSLAALILHWPPESFWQATPHDLVAALKGRRLLQAGLTTGALTELRQLLNRNTDNAQQL